MARTHRLCSTGALIVCLVGTQWSGTLYATEEEAQSTSARPAAAASAPGQSDSLPEVAFGGSSTLERLRFRLHDEVLTTTPSFAAADTQVWRGKFNFVPSESDSFAQRYRGRRGGRNGGAQAALLLGAIGTITGAALLVYANRPDCRTNQSAGGCGYGTKVAGVAVLSAGVAGLAVGALTWR